MNAMDILAPYANRPTSTEADFDEVALQVSPEALGDGIAHAFRSEQTPAFGSMVQQLFGGSDPTQRAGLLNQLVRRLGPALLGTLAGGIFGNRARANDSLPSPAGAGTLPTIGAAEAAQVTPEQVREIAEQAEKADPSVLDQVGSFYAKHPDVVKMLGGAALAIALGRIAKRSAR